MPGQNQALYKKQKLSSGHIKESNAMGSIAKLCFNYATQQLKPHFFQNFGNFLCFHQRQLVRHPYASTSMCCKLKNLILSSGIPLTSRYNEMASFVRSISSSYVFAWVWHPGSSTTSEIK